jgi:hypothetical protein
MALQRAFAKLQEAVPSVEETPVDEPRPEVEETEVEKARPEPPAADTGAQTPAKPKATAKAKNKAAAKTKAKAKATVKAKTKAAAKTKGKATAKAKAKSAAETPATGKTEPAAPGPETPETADKKAPLDATKKGKEPEPKKSKTEQEREKALKLADLQEDEEEPTPEQEQVLRDKKKSWFFNKQYEALPEQVRNLFENKTLGRAQKTKLVNEVVQHNSGSGSKYTLNLDGPYLNELSRHYEKVSGNKREKALPKALMVAKLGGQNALETALKDGDVFTVSDHGHVYYAFRSLSTCRTKGVEKEWTTSTASASTEDSHAILSTFCENFNPELQATGKETQAGEQLAICDGTVGPATLTEAALAKVEEALAWAGRLSAVSPRP